MKYEAYSAEKDGFYGAYFACRERSERCVIMMAGDNVDDMMAKSAAAWLNDHDMLDVLNYRFRILTYRIYIVSTAPE